MTAYDPLFRDEVIEARKSRLEGEIILAQPIRAHALTLLLVGIVALLAVWLAAGNYARSEVARGLLVTDRPSAKIIAMHPGQIAELLVSDGEIVRAGQRLAVVRIEQNNADGGSAVADSIAALEAQNSLAHQQADLAGRRAAADRARLSATLDGIRDQATNVAIQVDLQRQVVASARETFERIAPVMEKGFVSRFDYERRRHHEPPSAGERSAQQTGASAESRRVSDGVRPEGDSGRHDRRHGFIS